jgi:hypothetical protein
MFVEGLILLNDKFLTLQFMTATINHFRSWQTNSVFLNFSLCSRVFQLLTWKSYVCRLMQLN